MCSRGVVDVKPTRYQTGPFDPGLDSDQWSGSVRVGYRQANINDVITFLPRATDAGAVLALTREVLGREGLELAADKTRLAVHPDHLLERAADVGSPIRHGPGSRGGNLRADANAVPGLPRADPLVPLER